MGHHIVYSKARASQKEAWDHSDPIREAKFMFKLVSSGQSSVDEVRNLIRVDQNTSELWEQAKDPALKKLFRECTQFRMRVLMYFDGLVEMNQLEAESVRQ